MTFLFNEVTVGDSNVYLSFHFVFFLRLWQASATWLMLLLRPKQLMQSARTGMAQSAFTRIHSEACFMPGSQVTLSKHQCNLF